MDLKTRVKKGLTAGLVAGLAMDATEDIAYYFFRQPRIRSFDWVSITFTRKRPFTTREISLARAGHLVFTAALGGIFALIVPRAGKENLAAKGWLWGVVVWCVSQTVTSALKLPLLSRPGVASRVQHLMLASVYGLVLGAGLASNQKNPSWR